MPNASVPDRAKQACETRDPREWAWVEPSVWTERMLAALVNGVKGGKWYSLWDKVGERRTLEASWHAVARNNGAAGVDGMSVERFAAHAERYLDELEADLKAGRYRPDGVKRTSIPKAGGGQRPLGIPTVKDRIVQGALKRVLEPIFEWEFLDVSYGFRPGRGAKDALREVDTALKAGHTWVVDADIEGYFDNIPHAPLLAALKERISDGQVLALIEAYLGQAILEDLKRWTPTQGTPQGAVLSPLLANLYLHGLDCILSEQGYRIVRYADDCAPRRRTGGRKPSVQPCCTRDGGRPPEAAVQAEASNHPLLLPLREVVVRELGKGRARPGQVRTVESNASEPLMTCRKCRNGVKTGGESLLREQSGGDLFTAQAASGMKAARTRSRLLCGTWEPVTPMPREERKGKSPKRASTDAGYRDGATCSSAEGPVMGLERRGCPIRPEATGQPAMGGPR
jgi:retron-type reverse transcriptase